MYHVHVNDDNDDTMPVPHCAFIRLHAGMLQVGLCTENLNYCPEDLDFVA